MIRTRAVITPKPCQDRKVAAIRDAYDRRDIRIAMSVTLRATALRTSTNFNIANADGNAAMSHLGNLDGFSFPTHIRTVLHPF